MSYLALYRKYRPNSLEDLVGQNEVSSIIKNEVLSDKISHAYLFSGPRGTGKTSTAKIVAKMINCFNLDKNGSPCGKCESCLNIESSGDVVEIDAASNNGVDEIRELRDKVNLVPTCGKYKVYIIDEVHMLTTQAFNALLKTLEEPPSHVVFILATTEFYKIPATVVSRCQKFQFLKFSNDEIVDRLSKIAELEKIDVDNTVLFEISRLSDGGLRDAINMLDQLSSFKSDKILLDDVYKLNGVISYNEIANLLINIYNNDITSIISFVNDLNYYGKNVSKFIEDLVSFLKDVLIFKNNSDFSFFNNEKKEKIETVSNVFSVDNIYEIIISLNDLLYKIKSSNFSFILLSTYFIKLSYDLNKKDIDKVCLKDEEIDKFNLNIKSDFNYNLKKENNINVLDEKLKKIRINNSFATASKSNKENMLNNWHFVEKEATNGSYNSLIGIINDIEILVVGENNIIFLVKYDSLLERIYNYLNELEELLFKIFNIEYKIVFLAKDEWEYEKNNYIKKIKSGQKYKYIKEENDTSIDVVDDINDGNEVNKIISLLGEDVISYK